MKEYDDYLEDHPWVCGNYPCLEEVDEFYIFEKIQDKLLDSKLENLINWYLKMKDLLQSSKDSCIMCKKEVTYT